MNQPNLQMVLKSLKQNTHSAKKFVLGLHKKKRNLPPFQKLLKLRIQERDCNDIDSKNNSKGKNALTQLRESMLINVQNFESSDIRTTGKLVYSCRVNDKIISHSDNKRRQLSLIQKCKKSTDVFDSLRHQIVEKIKTKRAKGEKFRITTFPNPNICSKLNKENYEGESLNKVRKIAMSTCRNWQSEEKTQRYEEMSVSDFFGQESMVGTNFTKRFYQMRQRSQNRPRAHTQ